MIGRVGALLGATRYSARMTAPTDIPVNGDGTYDEPTWGEAGGPFTVPAFEAVGASDGQALDANTLNYEWQHVARWVRATGISRMVPSDQGLFGSFLFPGSGSWTTGGATLNSSIPAAWVVIDADDDGGVVVQFNVPAGTPHAFTANKQTFVALNEAGAVEYNAVNLGDPAPSPSAGYVNVWNVTTNGSEVVSGDPVLQTIPVFKDIGAESLGASELNVSGDANVGGTLDVVGAVDLDSTLAVAGSTTINNDVLITGETIAQGLVNCASLEVDTTSQFTGNVTCAADLTINGNTTIGNASGDTLTCNATTTFVNNVTVQGNTTIGNAGADTLTVNATTTFAANIDFGSNTITGALGTITTSTVNASTVAPTVINFQNTVQQSNDGRLVYDGRRLSIGDGSDPRTVHHPRTAYVISHTIQGDDGIVDITGASVQMIIEDAEWVYVRVSAKQTVDDSGESPTMLVSASNGVDSVAALNNGDDDVASVQLPATTAANQARPVSIVTRWRPTNDIAVPNNTSWTLQVRHDVSGAGTVNLTTSNVFLEVWYE